MRISRHLAELTSAWVETDDFIPAEPPPGWSIVHEAANGRFFATQRGNGWLRCMVTLDHFPHPDIPDKSERWLHLSVSRKNRMPSWEDIGYVKKTFLGPDSLAVQVLPPESEYVNDHPFCLHLWVCLDRRLVPDFRCLGTI